MSDSPRMREHPRVDCDDMEARYRVADGPWHRCLVGDLSAGGARLLGADRLDRGAEITLALEPLDRAPVRVSARVMRVVDQQVGVRFVDMSDEQWSALEEELRPRLARLEPEPVAVADGEREVSAAGLQLDVIYDRLGVAPDCSDAELSESAELVLTCIGTALASAVGPRRERLLAAQVALERMRPLWTNPEARAAYDARLGLAPETDGGS